MKKADLFNAIHAKIASTKIISGASQIERITALVNGGTPFVLTLDEYLDTSELTYQGTPNNLRDLLSRRVKFRKMILVYNGNVTDITPYNFKEIWRPFEKRLAIVRDNVPQKPWKSQMFEDGMPQKRAQKHSIHGFQRITRAYQTMENIGTMIR